MSARAILVGGPRDGTTIPAPLALVAYGDHRDPDFAVFDLYRPSAQYNANGERIFFYAGQERLATAMPSVRESDGLWDTCPDCAENPRGYCDACVRAAEEAGE